MKKVRVTSIFVLLLLIMANMPNSIAKADIYGGKWNSDFYCKIQTSTYYGITTNAMVIWNNALDSIGSNIDICSSNYTINVNFTETSLSGVDWYAQTNLYPYATAIPYTGADVVYNKYLLSNCTTTQKSVVAIHEMGHVLGLAHTTTMTNKSVMYTYIDDAIDRGYTVPQTYDKNQLDRLY